MLLKMNWPLLSVLLRHWTGWSCSVFKLKKNQFNFFDWFINELACSFIQIQQIFITFLICNVLMFLPGSMTSKVKKCIVLIQKLNYITRAFMIRSMPTCMWKILGLNKQLFHSKERASNENLECPNNESDTSAAGLTPAFPSTSASCPLASISSSSKDFSPNYIPLTRPERV